MRIALLTSIFPPDVGGPATHAAALSRALRGRGHDVTVLALTPEPRPIVEPGFVAYPRRWPWPLRFAALTGWLARHGGRFDVVYATGLQLPAVLGAKLARRPVVVKVVGDPVWERARRQGLTAAGFDDFQRAPEASARIRLMRVARDWWLRRADAVTVPSAYLQETVAGWLGGARRPALVYNRVSLPAGLARDGRRPDGRLALVYVGRLIPHKRVDLILAALERVPGAELEVIGEGPEEPRLRERAAELGVASRVAFRGTLPHDEALARLAASDLLVLASEYEGLPHVAVEALAAGTPVASLDVGGVREVVVDGENGLIVQAGTVEAFSRGFARLMEDAALRRRLAAGALERAADWRLERSVDELEALLASVAADAAR